MKMVFNLETGKESYYMDSIPTEQALKTEYAIENNLTTRLATDFDNLMKELQEKIEVGKNTLLLGNLSVLIDKQ